MKADDSLAAKQRTDALLINKGTCPKCKKQLSDEKICRRCRRQYSAQKDEDKVWYVIVRELS